MADTGRPRQMPVRTYLRRSRHISSRIVSATEQPLVPWRRAARHSRQLLLLRIQGGPARARQRQHRMSSAVLRGIEHGN